MGTLLLLGQATLAIVAFTAGIRKLIEVQRVRDAFTRWGYSRGFMKFTGLYEVLAGILLVLGFWSPVMAALGAATLVVLFTVAIYTHYRSGDTTRSFIPPLLLWLLSICVLAWRWTGTTI